MMETMRRNVESAMPPSARSVSVGFMGFTEVRGNRWPPLLISLPGESEKRRTRSTDGCTKRRRATALTGSRFVEACE